MYATIILNLYETGIHFTCEDAGIDELISRGDGDKLIDLINDVELICNPKVTFKLTEKGKKYLKEIEEKEL